MIIRWVKEIQVESAEHCCCKHSLVGKVRDRPRCVVQGVPIFKQKLMQHSIQPAPAPLQDGPNKLDRQVPVVAAPVRVLARVLVVAAVEPVLPLCKKKTV